MSPYTRLIGPFADADLIDMARRTKDVYGFSGNFVIRLVSLAILRRTDPVLYDELATFLNIFTREGNLS